MQHPRLLTLCLCSVDALLTLCWRSVDALLMLCWCSVDALLMLCWRSLSSEVTSRLRILPRRAANPSIMGKFCSTPLGLYKMQHPRLLTFCWRSVDAQLTLCWRCVDALSMLIFRRCDIDINISAYKSCRIFDYGQKPQHSPWIIQGATPEIVDALLTLIFTMGLWPCHFLFWA